MIDAAGGSAVEIVEKWKTRRKYGLSEVMQMRER